MTPRRILDAVEISFWRVAAATTGLAVRHRRSARLAPILLLAAASFGLGRSLGLLILKVL